MHFIVPQWPAPENVRAVQTVRTGGYSLPPWASFNLAGHVGDDPAHVAANRQLLAVAISPLLAGTGTWHDGR